MDNAEFRGDFSDVPFAAVLGGIRRKQAAGYLTVEGGGKGFLLTFDKGGLCIGQEDFPGAEFLDALARRNLFDAPLLQCFRDRCSRNNRPLLRGILESGLMPPDALWKEIELFWKERLYPLFDRSRGNFRFEIPETNKSVSLVRPLSLTPIILEGVRRMKATGLIDAFLPGAGNTIRSLPAYLLDSAGFEPPVFYVFDLLAVPRTTEELCASSVLGDEETRKILFALMCLGAAVETEPPGRNAGRTSLDLSLTEMEGLFGVFNEKCSYIYKYISKELGPVAMNVIEKAFADVRDHIDPALQSFSLTPDGKVEFRPFLRMNINVSTEDRRRDFLRGLDEILSAAVLAVKKTLGSEYEADLVKNLEKIGDLP